MILLISPVLLAQSTPATGDPRTITEPTFPATCATVRATKWVASTTTVNMDPFNSTCGSTGGTFGTLGCTGGTSFEPDANPPGNPFVIAETLDNTAVQNALNSCTHGQAVELIPGTAGQTSFVLSPWTIPTGVSIIVDAGIRVFASRNRTDYGGTNCGLVTSGSSNCTQWITAAGSGSGIYGYGILDARSWDAYIGSTTQGFYVNRIQSKCNNNGGPEHGEPNCTPNGAGPNSFGPDGIKLSGATNFTMYKITLKDSGDFLINWSGGSGFTGWDIALFAPFEVQNTDGWDPTNVTNGTLTHSWISNGDNMMAVKASSSAVSGISFTFNQTGAGIATTVGTAQNAGVSNILVDHLQQNGNLFSDISGGIMLASSTANGGSVNQVTFSNICMVNEANSVRLYTNYGCDTGSDTPSWTNILLQNIAVLGSTPPYTTGQSGHFTFQGLSGHPIGVQFNNFTVAGTNQGIAQQCSITKDQYTNYYQGPGAVPSSVISQLVAGTSNTASGTAGTSTPYCTTSSWSPLRGELNIQTATSNNNQIVHGPLASYVLQAVLQPATDISTKEQPLPTASVEFLDNGTPVGTSALGPDGTYAYLVINVPPPGTHVYTAVYPGDAHYSSYTFGSVTAINSGPPTQVQGHAIFTGKATIQ